MRTYLRRSLFERSILLGLFLLLLIMAPIGPNAMKIEMVNYLPMHTFMEMVSVIISVMIFAITWNVYSVQAAKPAIILGCTLFSVALLDFVHLLSYPEMPQFVTPSSAQKSIYFWLSARTLLAVSMLFSAFLAWQPFKTDKTRYLVLFSSLSLSGLLIWIGLFRLDITPKLFVPEKGLTEVKIETEFMLVALYSISTISFYLRSRKEQRAWMSDLAKCNAIIVMSESYFTFYSSHSDIINILGHIYKLIAYAFLYRAVFLNSVRYPIDQLIAAEVALKESQKKLETTQIAVDHSSDYIFMFNAKGKFSYCNKQASQRLGYAQQELLSMSVGDIDVDYRDANWLEHWQQLSAEGTMRFETSHRTKQGDIYPVEVSVAIIKDATAEEFACAIVRDISERLSAQERINNLAYYDQITGLPNRAFLEDLIVKAISAAQRNLRKVAVLFLDLDHFKNINDSLGHQSGDNILVQVSSRIKTRIRAADSVGRYGGDEFIVVLTDLHSSIEAANVAQQFLTDITKPYYCNNVELRLTASIGISVYPDDALSFSQLVMNADAAMYHAKSQGRDNFQFFSAEMSRKAATQLDMENRLRRAIELQQFVLHYQPQIDIETGNIVGVEALIRWLDPERGLVPPLEFIPLAEERGLIIPIGDWALEEACRQNAIWQKAGIPPITVAVNVAASQFHHANLIKKIEDVLMLTNLNPMYLEIEMTESAVMQDAEQLIDDLAALRKFGISLAMDDFGTGYSSLSYLKRFRLNKLKIDRSFIRDIHSDNEDLSIVKAIIALAHQMKIKVIAEGVETELQRDILKNAKCDKYQGYYFSKPLPAEDIERLLKEQKAAEASP